MAFKKHNPGCNCCDGFVSECPNDDTTPFEGLSITGIPTTLTLGPFTIPDFNGTYLLTASDVCAPDAGDVPLPIFGIPTAPDCCTFSWEIVDVQEEPLDDVECFTYDLTNFRIQCVWSIFITAQYVDSDTIEYTVDIAVRVSLKADVYDNTIPFDFGEQTSHCMTENLIQSGSIIGNNSGGLLVPVTADIVAGGDAEYTCSTAFFCEVDEYTGTGNWALDDEWEVTLEWV